MSYTKASLAANERILLLTSFTWWITVGWLVATTPFVLMGSWFLLILPLIAYIERYFTEFAVTNQGVLVKQGIIRRRVTRIAIGQIEGVFLTQSVLGRILNYGTIIVHGSGQPGALLFTKVGSPVKIQALINSQISATK